MKKFIMILFGLFALAMVNKDNSAQKNEKLQQVPEYAKKRKAYKRVEWFNQQRQEPDGNIPLDIYWAERDKVIREVRLQKSAVEMSKVRWQTVGPHGVNALPDRWGVTSGRVRGVAIHPTNPDIVYMGAAAGGIWKTTDGGENWTALGENLESLTFGAIAIDPKNPLIVYAGTGEARFGFNDVIYDGKGLFKSTDGGETWNEPTNAFGLQTHFAALRVDPVNSNIIYAALASGYSFFRNPGNEGIWVSNNAGVTWTRTLRLNDAFDVVPHPNRAGQVFAAIGGANNDSSGVWHSTDNGRTWTRRSQGLPSSSSIGRIHLSIPGGSLSIMYAVIFSPSGNTRVFKSTDNGSSWQQIASELGGNYGLGAVDQGGYDLCIAANPQNSDEVYVGNVELYRTINGKDFEVVRQLPMLTAWDSPMHVDYHTIAYSPSDPRIIYVGCDGGIYRSRDKGVTWEHRNAGINTLQFYRISAHPNSVDMVIGGTQDNGIVARRNVNAGSVQRWNMLGTGDGFECFFDPTNPNIVYASVQNVLLLKSINGLDGFNFIGMDLFGLPIINGIPEDERQLIFLAPFFMHATNPAILYTATNRVYRTTNRGDNWVAISGSAVDTAGAVIQTLAQSAINPRHMILGASSRVFVSTDGGFNWTNRSAGLPDRFVTRVVTHPHKDSTMFAVIGGFFDGQKIFRTPDLGETWVNISGNLPNVPHSDLFIDPHFPNNLVMYVANDLGVYSTNDGGIFWRRDSDGMPVVPALDFDYAWDQTKRVLYVATHGRSVFRADLPLSALTLTSPNGGEKYAVGAAYEIRWVGNGFSNPDNVRLEFSLDNGRSWRRISDNVPNTGNFRWRVPTTITIGSDSALVRVINPQNQDIMDESNAAFKIFIDSQFSVVATAPFTNDQGTFTGASWGDFNNDDHIDLALTSEHPTERQLRLYRNNRAGGFTDVSTTSIGSFPFQSFASTWGDFDRDNDLDLFVGGVFTKLLRNLGNGTFTDATSTVIPNLDPTEVTSTSWVDWNRDHQLDLFVTTGGSAFAAGRKNVLYGQIIPGVLTTNLIDGNFDSRGQAWGDFNNDGYPDLFVANYGQNNLLYKVVKSGANVNLVRMTTGTIVTDGGNSNAAAWGDYDNDGDLDLFVANDGPNFLYRNNGNETFARITNLLPGQDAGNSKTCTWGDFDNDGDLDLFVGNEGPNFLYINSGFSTFSRFELSAVTTTDDFTNGAAWGDYDNDGDLDLLIANGVVGTSETENNILFRNKGNGNNWLEVKLHGVISNFSGIGARLHVHYRLGNLRRQIREITGQTGKGQNSMVAHFGLGSATTIDSLIVQWPSQRITKLINIAANQQVTVFEIAENNLFVKTSGGDLAAANGFSASAWGDYNNDGLDDLFLAHDGGNNALYRNLGNGSFARVSTGPVMSDAGKSTAGSWGDYDNDGDLDLYVTNLGGVNFFYRNGGYPNFALTRINTGSPATEIGNSTACSWGDYDNDGDLDLFVSNQGSNAQNFFYRNIGSGQFERITIGAIATQLGSATSCAWVDFDNDRDLDLFVTYEDRSDVLYRNLGAPNFGFSAISTGELVTEATASKGCSWGDYDNDGDLDVFVVKSGKSKLYRNDGNGVFTRITQGDVANDEADSRSSVWADADNDGFLNLLIVNSNFNQMYDGNPDNVLFRSQPSPITLTPGSHFGASWSDIDNDGDMDLFVPNSSGNGALFRNNGNDRSWLLIKCIGTKSNKSAIGTRIRVKAKSFEKLDPIWQSREITAQSGKGSQNSFQQLFGLGTAMFIDSLVVEWPASPRLVLTNLPVNQRLLLREQDATDFAIEEASLVTKTKFATGASWADIDNDGDQDLLVTTRSGQNQLFLNNGNGIFTAPSNHSLTRENMRSTASTWADVNNDGWLDVFVANEEVPGALYLNRGNGEFLQVTQGDILKDRVKATAASWGDFDNDGLVDLFVATESGPNLLYHNKGEGVLTKITQGEIVQEALNSRAAAWADYDNDGDLDLFVANYNEKNILYRNEGNGKMLRIQQPPFTTDVGPSVGCSWGDFDNDGDFDLFITNYDGQNFFYRNDAGGFVKIIDGPIATDTGKSTGSSWIDFDFDGDLDLFVSDFEGKNRLYRNLGNDLFERSPQEKITHNTGSSQGAAWADIDSDGDLDLFVANFNEQSFLYRNTGNSNRWINVKLVGAKNNVAGIGAKVKARAIIDGAPMWQLHQVSAQTSGGFSGQNSLDVEFGLANATMVDSIIVQWPSGTVQKLTNIAPNQFIKIIEQSPTGIEHQTELPTEFRLHAPYPNPFNASVTIPFGVPKSSHVSIKIYDLLGRDVITLMNRGIEAGSHTVVWNGQDYLQSIAASGVYFVRMQAENFVAIKKIIMLR